MNHGACGGSSERFGSGAAVPVVHGCDRGTALSDDLASGQRTRPRPGLGHGVVCPALAGASTGPLQRWGSAGSGRSAAPEWSELLRPEARPAGEAQGSSAEPTAGRRIVGEPESGGLDGGRTRARGGLAPTRLGGSKGDRLVGAEAAPAPSGLGHAGGARGVQKKLEQAVAEALSTRTNRLRSGPRTSTASG